MIKEFFIFNEIRIHYAIIFYRNESMFIKIDNILYRNHSCQSNVFNSNILRLVTLFSSNQANTMPGVIVVYQNITDRCKKKVLD